MAATAVLHLAGETPTGELTLQCNPNLRVTRVCLGGRECGFTQAEAGRITIGLPAGAMEAQPILEVAYAGRLAQGDTAGEQARAFIGEEMTRIWRDRMYTAQWNRSWAYDERVLQRVAPLEYLAQAEAFFKKDA